MDMGRKHAPEKDVDLEPVAIGKGIIHPTALCTNKKDPGKTGVPGVGVKYSDDCSGLPPLSLLGWTRSRDQ